jgi:hypothetical protein
MEILGIQPVTYASDWTILEYLEQVFVKFP